MTIPQSSSHSGPEQDEADARRGSRTPRRRGCRCYGVPVAVKDNIDVAGIPTTAACPDFAYTPSADAYGRWRV